MSHFFIVLYYDTFFSSVINTDYSLINFLIKIKNSLRYFRSKIVPLVPYNSIIYNSRVCVIGF